jgi:hypothetical protein
MGSSGVALDIRNAMERGKSEADTQDELCVFSSKEI